MKSLSVGVRSVDSEVNWSKEKEKDPFEKATFAIVFRKRAVNNKWGGVN
jgi:hypothetical protein